LFLFLFLFFAKYLSCIPAFRKKGSKEVKQKKYGDFWSRKKSIWAHLKKCGFSPLRFFFVSLGCFPRIFSIAFLDVSQQGEFKNAIKKIHGKTSAAAKKHSLTQVTFFLGHGAPCRG
jgi:hypothetical protein